MSKVTMAEALELTTPEYQALLQKMLDRTGLPNTILVDAMLAKFTGDRSLARDEMLALASLIRICTYNYAPKLTQAQRCEILALHHAGFNRNVLAALYKVDRRTVTHIYNPHSPHYRSIRDHRNGIGRDKFAEIYLTTDVVNAALAFTNGVANKTQNNKFANRKQGLHVTRGPNCNYDHRVIIQWLEASEANVPESGWYYRDLDSLFPDSWLSCGEESLRNSQACFSAMLEELADEI